MDRKLYLLTTGLCLVGLPIWSQVELALDTDQPQEIKSRFEMEVSPYMLQKILAITGEKITLTLLGLNFDHQPLDVKSCKTRGNTTLKFRRKSLSLSLNQSLHFQQTAVKKLAINNLAMDQNYWRVRLCFLLMHKIGIFPLINQYTELMINGQTQGTYLMIQKPEDYCKSVESPLLVRRENGSNISIEYSDQIDAKKKVKQLKNSRTLNKNLSGKQLSDSLKSILELSKYQRWLAFNFLIMNGDYYDELFLFFNPETNRFDIIPWDYDDVFATQPHEGQQIRNKLLGDRLLFSSEATIDLVIGQDDYLYGEYLKDFQEVLSTLTEANIKHAFDQVYKELTPYYLSPDVIKQSQYDQSGLTNLNLLQQDLIKHYQFLLRRRETIDNTLMMNK